jgi:predicted transcriptional regulator
VSAAQNNAIAEKIMPLTGLQLKLGRTALDLNQEQLARFAGVTPSTVVKLEASGLGRMRGSGESLAKIVEALTKCGVGLMPDGLSIGLSNPRVPWPVVRV